MPKLGLNRWEEIGEAFYSKYSGLQKWQKTNYQFVCKHGFYKTFTGRHYKFSPKRKNDGTLEYPWPSVCNFAVQGTATGDVVPLVLVKLFPVLNKISKDIKLINQVHDSIVLDCPSKYLTDVCTEALTMFRAIPKLIKQQYDYDWVVPMDGECKYGEDWSDMKTFKGE